MNSIGKHRLADKVWENAYLGYHHHGWHRFTIEQGLTPFHHFSSRLERVGRDTYLSWDSFDPNIRHAFYT